MKIRAPAKVNLYLKIVGRRRDGYHLLDTLMVPVNLYDEIEIRRHLSGSCRTELSVTCDHPAVPSGQRNLAYRAASLFLEKKELRIPIQIHIRKRIPVGGGLGGGSSDAAATLQGLNRLLRSGCSRRELLSLAACLGADVPFFIYGRPARARGIGEKLRPLAHFPRFWMVILYPGFPVSTRWVYENLKLTKPIENTSIKTSQRDLREVPRLLFNNLEDVTLRRYPRIGSLKERLLQEGAEGALMSGSGSSVFGIFSARETAREAYDRLRREEGVQAYLVRSLN